MLQLDVNFEKAGRFEKFGRVAIRSLGCSDCRGVFSVQTQLARNIHSGESPVTNASIPLICLGIGKILKPFLGFVYVAFYAYWCCSAHISQHTM